MRFDRIFMGSAALALVAALAGPAMAADAAAPKSAELSTSGNVCLRTIDIKNTTVPDEQTILFHMRDGKVWKNELRGRCAGLRFNGFVYEATPPSQICGNLQTIRAIQTGSVCMLGPFVPYEGKPPAMDSQRDEPAHDHAH